MASFHDRFARKVFRRPEEARALLRAALPDAVLHDIDLATLALVGGNLIDDRLGERATDLLFSASHRGRPLLIYVLIEHKSAFDRWTPLQVLEYQVRIWNFLRDREGPRFLLPTILPIVVYHGERRLPAEWRLQSLFTARADEKDGTPLRLDYGLVVLDLGARSDASLINEDPHGSALAKLALLALKSIREGDLLSQMSGWGGPIRSLLSTRRGQAWFQIVVRYLLSAARRAPPIRKIRDTVDRIAGPEAGEIVMSTAEKLIAKGRIQGIEQGLLRGVQQQRRATIPKILHARFGAVPEGLTDRLSKFDDETTLDRLIELAATAKDLEAFGHHVRRLEAGEG